jgi:hypothetical protein
MNMPWEQADITTTDYPIGGKMIAAKVEVSDDAMQMFRSEPAARQEMRERLVMELAQAMLNSKLVEINQYQNPASMNTTIVARAYLAPDATVKLLRTLNNR